MEKEIVPVISEKEDEIKFITQSYKETERIVLSNYKQVFEKLDRLEDINQLVTYNIQQTTKLYVLYQDFLYTAYFYLI